MAELADAVALGATGRKSLGVQIPLPAPLTLSETSQAPSAARTQVRDKNNVGSTSQISFSAPILRLATNVFLFK